VRLAWMLLPRWSMKNHLSKQVRVLALGGLIACAVMLSATSAQAQTAGDKFGRGIAGMTTGVLELPGNMIQESHERGPGVGIPLGLAKGLGMVVARELCGVYEFITAPLDVPRGYQPVLKPTYPWDYFKDV
jgi:putative exosortase-associated protein (TIGR04073 family)